MSVGYAASEWKQRKKVLSASVGANSSARSFAEGPADYEETRPVRIRARGVSGRVNHAACGDLQIMPSLCHARR